MELIAVMVLKLIRMDFKFMRAQEPVKRTP